MNDAQKRILIIDDDAMFTQVLARALEKRGYAVCEAHNAIEAIKAMREFQPQRVTQDLKMADTSGLQLIPKLLEIAPELQIVVLTGYSSIATAVQAIKLGARNYLCKPVNADEILAAFEEAPVPQLDIAPDPLSVNRLEWEHIQKVLAEHKGNISATARALGMHRRTLQRKLQKRPVQR